MPALEAFGELRSAFLHALPPHRAALLPFLSSARFLLPCPRAAVMRPAAGTPPFPRLLRRPRGRRAPCSRARDRVCCGWDRSFPTAPPWPGGQGCPWLGAISRLHSRRCLLMARGGAVLITPSPRFAPLAALFGLGCAPPRRVGRALGPAFRWLFWRPIGVSPLCVLPPGLLCLQLPLLACARASLSASRPASWIALRAIQWVDRTLKGGAVFFCGLAAAGRGSLFWTAPHAVLLAHPLMR